MAANHVEVLVALCWDEGSYIARCLGVRDVRRNGASMEEAVEELAVALSQRFRSGGGLDARPDRSVLWQPLPVEMVAPLDVAVA